jgi:cytochrome bd ubiquinol oxidase subunit II
MALQTLWFVLWGLLWAVYFMLDGFDFGAGMLRPFLTRDDGERRLSLAAVGPVWDGNEVWLITAGGATFAAFPATYASMFSFLYLPMLLILFSLIIRGVSIEFRSKHETARWRSTWDWALAITSFTTPLVLGVGFGNIFQGLLFDASGYHGSFFQLFNPYGLLTAVLFVLLFLQHGALWLSYKLEGGMGDRSRGVAGTLWYVLLVVAAGFLVLTGFATKLLGNYLSHPGWFVVPVLAVAALIAQKILHERGRQLPAFLTIYNSSSGPYTLKVMTIVALVFVPIVVVYQFLVYRFFRGKTKPGDSAEGY